MPLDLFLRDAATTQPLCRLADGTWGWSVPKAIVAGSFNPLHRGHRRLANVACERMGIRPHEMGFELSVVNVAKPTLGLQPTLERLEQFTNYANVYITKAPTFAEKALLFPNCVFVVGHDTAIRILDRAFHDHNPQRHHDALTTIDQRGCRFLVAGRIDANGEFQPADGLAVPQNWAHLFESIPEADFRVDISSTQLRNA